MPNFRQFCRISAAGTAIFGFSYQNSRGADAAAIFFFLPCAKEGVILVSSQTVKMNGNHKAPETSAAKKGAIPKRYAVLNS